MKLCRESNGAKIYVGRAATVRNPLFECLHCTVECLNTNERFYWSVAPTHFKIYCRLCTVSVKAKNANKNI